MFFIIPPEKCFVVLSTWKIYYDGENPVFNSQYCLHGQYIVSEYQDWALECSKKFKLTKPLPNSTAIPKNTTTDNRNPASNEFDPTKVGSGFYL